MSKYESQSQQEINAIARAIKACLGFVCQDGFHLCGINIRPDANDKKTHVLEATDGHTAIQCRLQVGWPEDMNLYIETKDADIAVKLLTNHVKETLGPLDNAGNNLELFCARKGIDCRSPKDRGFAYPPIDQVAPRYDDKGNRVPFFGVNPAYLARIEKTAKALGMSKHVGVVIRHGSELDPITCGITADNVTATIVIMPMRV